MSSYFTRAALETEIPPDFIIEALDDDNDTNEDAGLWELVVDEACGAVDAYLSRRFTTPLTGSIPRIVTEAAKIFAGEILYNRRGVRGSENPFTRRAESMRDLLEKIASGEVGLGPGQSNARPPISIISERAGTVPRGRLNG